MIIPTRIRRNIKLPNDVLAVKTRTMKMIDRINREVFKAEVVSSLMV
jgi:hypothetical protein